MVKNLINGEEAKSVQVPPGIHKELELRKIIPAEPYWQVIERLLKATKKE